MARKLPLHTKILIGGLVGAVGGILAHVTLGKDPGLAAFITYGSQPLGQIFLRLLILLVVPLICSALVLGVAGMGDLRHLGRVGLKALLYTVVLSAIAVLIGLTVVSIFRPGEGLAASVPQQAAPASPAAEKSPIDLLVQI